MIRDEIKNSMTDIYFNKEDEISAKFTFLNNFTGFSGHFPSNPVLPGVCQIQCVLLLLSEKYGKELQIQSVSRAKFLNTVSPGEEITIQGSCRDSENIISGKFKITKKSPDKRENVSRISLQCF